MYMEKIYEPKEIWSGNFRVLVGNDGVVVLDDKECKEISYMSGYNGHGLQTNFVDDECRYEECMKVCDEIANNFRKLKEILSRE